jgi:zinc protease
MRRLPKLGALLALLALAATLPGAAIPFPQAGSDLKAEPAARFGTLPNGLRYVVLPNREPKQRVSLRLLVLAGSFEESESERGLAHFLEHMAFNGSTHFAPGTLVERLQRLGMGFGADTNASTGFDRTLYMLEMPDTKPATVSEGLQILSDYCGGLLLEQAMVDKERGIILSEKRARDSVGYRTLVAELEFMEAGTRVPQRLPIGLTEVIEKSNRERFVGFYNAWYRPELMAVVVVGDIDAAALEKEVSERFSGIGARAPEPAPADLGRVQEFAGVRARFHGEAEAPDTQAVIAATVPYTRPQDTAFERLKELRRNLAVEMINRRLSILSKKENAPFIKASASIDTPFNLYRAAEVAVTSKAEQWQAGLAVAEQELRRALQYGFRPDELREAAADFRNDLEQAVKTAPTRRSDELAGEIAESLVDREVFTSPADDLALLGPALARVTPAECLAALRDAWSAPGRYVFVSGNAKVEGDADQAVAAAYARSAASAVGPTDALSSVAWGYADFGPAGSVASRQHVDDLDITEVTLSNGVRLNLKKTDFEANTIHVSARLGAGQLTEPAGAEPGLSTFTNLTYSAGGLGKHSADDLQRILSGRTVGVQFGSTLDAFMLSGDTNREDLALELQYLTATILDPGYRPEAMRVARKRIEDAYLRFAHTEGGPMALHVNRILAGGDPRFGLPPRDELMRRSLDEEKAWLAPTLSGAALEVSFVGDFDVDAVIDAAARTLGTLPRREPRPALDDLRRVSFPREPFRKDYAIDTEIPKSLVGVYWPTADAMDVHRARRLAMLASVLSDRLRVRVREQMGSAYSPSVASSASDILPGYGYLAAIVITEPSKAKQVQDVVVAVAADMCANGVAQDELDRAKNPIMTQIRESERTNGYWLTVLSRAQERPEVLDWARSRRFDFQSITKADIDALASAYLPAEKASRVVIHPYPTPAGSPSSAVTPPPDGL